VGSLCLKFSFGWNDNKEGEKESQEEKKMVSLTFFIHRFRNPIERDLGDQK
jgi:hypothetical protein